MFCREQVASFIAHQAELESHGPRVIIVGNGAPFFLKAFRDHVGRSVPIYTDPELNAYKALSMRRNPLSSLNPKTLLRGVEAYRSGHRQGATKGDTFQLGGVFWVDSSGEVQYAYRSRFAGDHPEMSEVLKAVSGQAG